VAHSNGGRQSEAEAAFARAVRLKADYAAARYNLGVVSLARGNRGAALAQYHALKTMNEELAARLYGGLRRGMVLSLAEK
jgi:hypothetical protein